MSITGAAQVNQCETNSYTISFANTTGNPTGRLIVRAKLANLSGFTYISGTASLDIDGEPAFCMAEPTLSGSDLIWDVDLACGSPITLTSGQTLNVSFDLRTTCEAVSGSLNASVDYHIGSSPFVDDTGALSITVLPGGVTIKKIPNVLTGEVGDQVVWTLIVENTGLGVIHNVVVSDVLGSGLAYIASSPVGINEGQTTIWNKARIPTFEAMNPGDKVTIEITATIIS
ncbi:MAG: DUF11 domain-containing protein, partial [Chloroflexi bacterium]|nr:DUF11 domain-containing protein [Chloroflexota bacterium]